MPSEKDHIVEKGQTQNSPAVQDLEKLTPLMIAIKNYNLSKLRKLLGEKPNLETKNADGCTALMIAAGEENIIAIELLLASGAEINVKNNYGYTALMLASASGKLQVVETLTEKKADLEVQNKYGNTALIMAVTSGNPKIVQTLVNAGACLETENCLEESAGIKACMGVLHYEDMLCFDYLLSEDTKALCHERYLKDQKMFEILQKASRKEEDKKADLNSGDNPKINDKEEKSPSKIINSALKNPKEDTPILKKNLQKLPVKIHPSSRLIQVKAIKIKKSQSIKQQISFH